MKRIEREKHTVDKMIRLYCRKHHNASVLCSECNELLEYSLSRIDKCLFWENKPVCSECTVHCYKKHMRDRVRQVMRYAGPRMLLRYPYLAVMHFLDKSGK